MDLIYWRHPTVPGIKVEEVTDAGEANDKYWLDGARQIYCENGRDDYREIGHFANGAPFLYGESTRISITHCPGLFAVATLPPTPDADLSRYEPQTAMGIDAERADRRQVLAIRERFLSDEELVMIPANDIAANVQAWTIKEAVYKAALGTGLSLRDNIRIRRMPIPGPPVPVFKPEDYGLKSSQKELPEDFFGEAEIVITGNSASASDETGNERDLNNSTFKIYSYLSDDFIITLAWSPLCIRFGKSS